MKSFFSFILLTLLLSCSDGSRMRRHMEQVDSLNQRYESLANDSMMPAVTEWMDRHGTPNERMRAHYLLGSVYRDRGQAPEALNEFHVAAQCADTTASDCNYHLLSRVHGQMADILMNEYLPNEALREEKLCKTYAKIADDTLMWLVSSEQIGRAYNSAGYKDSAAMALERAYTQYQQYHYAEEALNSLEPLIFYLQESNDYIKAKSFMDIFETHSDLYDSNTLTAIHPSYYYVKGRQYNSEAKPDSALLFFLKLLALSDNPQYAEMAYHGIYKTYMALGNNDSVAKYADLCYNRSNESFYTASTMELRRMQAHYNYSQYQAQARQKEKEASQMQRRLIIVSSIAVVIILLLVLVISHLIVRKRNQIARLTREYEYRLEEILNVEHELENSSLDNYREIKEKELRRNQQQLLEMLGISKSNDSASVNLCDNETYRLFQKAALHPTFKLEEDHWKKLHELFDEKIPNFRESLTHGKAITERDLRLCMLLRMQFGISEICAIMQTYSQYVSTRRRQLLRKYYKIEGKPEDFDRIITLIG